MTGFRNVSLCTKGYGMKCHRRTQQAPSNMLHLCTSSQAEHALNWEDLASQGFLMYLEGLGGLMSNSLHLHGSNFPSLME